MLLDGKKLALSIQSDIASQVSKLSRKPGLAVLLVGNHPASQVYVKAKMKACHSVGILSQTLELPSGIAESDLLKQIDLLNRDPAVDGILVQLPLPQHIDETRVIAAISPEKDVDGFHPINVGKMLLGLEGGFLPCTPRGIQVLLEENRIETKGKHVVILGRSNIVGKPLAALLVQKKQGANATVTIAHSYSEHLPQLARSADILIAALGKPHFVTPDFVKPGATVIDVGIHRLPDGRLTGDVDFENVSKVAKHITPVPGGIGPMTIAMLLKNTLLSCLQCLLLVLAVSCQKQSPPPFTAEAMHVPYQIIIGDSISQAKRSMIQKLIDDTFLEIAATWDLENPRSELSELNQAEANALIPLSPTLQQGLALCQNIDSQRFESLSIHNGILKKDPSVPLDLRTLAIGTGIDLLIQKLEGLELKNVMIEWGGHFRAIGHHPQNTDWLIPIHPALTINQHSMAPIPLRNAALAVSLPQSSSQLAFVAVIAPTCALADRLAHTAALFPSRKEAELWAQEMVEHYPDAKFWILSNQKPTR